jgi:hypothetical protein
MLARALTALAVVGFGPFALVAGCEPQDIYLFDDPPAQNRADAGTGGSEPGSEPEDTDDPEDTDESEDADESEDTEGPESVQPDCRTAACDVCVEQGLCELPGAVVWCHPESGFCLLACDPAALAGEVGSCPAPQRCDPELGLCVACVSNDDCGEPFPVCDARIGDCVECSSTADCATRGGGVCAQPERRCVQCLSNVDCSGFEEDPVCLVAEQRCVECLVNSDCTREPDRPLCSSEFECEDSD